MTISNVASNVAIKFGCICTVAAGTWLGALESKLPSANAQQSKKPDTGRTIGLGSRGDCPAITALTPDLTALTPDKNEDTVTLSQSPTFRFYSPYPNAKYRLRLFSANKKQMLYRQDITSSNSNKLGIFAVTLKNVAALKPKQRYFWELEYFCSNKPQAANPIVFGWLYRDQLTDSQKQEFSKANTSTQRIDFYRKNGIWIELLDEIAKSLPKSQTIWQQTLDAEGLQSISKKPLLPIK
jgi:hypothetical protein